MFRIRALGSVVLVVVTVILASMALPVSTPPSATGEGFPGASAQGSENTFPKDADGMSTRGKGANAPVLQWCGTSGYASDGVDPDSGDTLTSFAWCVLYRSPRGTPPAAGYPKVKIEKASSVVVEATMSADGWAAGPNDYKAGRRYVYARTLSDPGADYTYTFTATDVRGRSAVPLSGSGPSVYALPVLDWCQGWTTAVTPTEGDRNTDFDYCVQYTPTSGDDPSAYPPAVHIWKGGVELSGSPFATSCTGSSPYACDYHTTLSEGIDYSSQFEVTNRFGHTVSYPSSSASGPGVYALPVLEWCSGWSSGVQPMEGDPNTFFHYCVRYTPTIGDGWWNFPAKVHVWKGGVEISGSPFTMPCYGYDPPYTCDHYRWLPSPSDYTYQFEATNRFGSTVHHPGSPAAGPTVYALPILEWCAGWSNGVNPTQGDPNTVFQYCVRYTPTPGDPAASHPPKVRIWKSGVEISGSPFTMTCNAPAPYTCGFDTTLEADTYTYQFQVTNRFGSTVWYPNGAASGPTVYALAVLDWCDGWPDGVDPDDGNGGTAFSYCVKYTPTPGDSPSSFPPKVHLWKGGAEISGSPFTMDCSGSAPPYSCTYSWTLEWGSDYEYGFEATNRFGSTVIYPESPAAGPFVSAMQWCEGWSSGVDPSEGEPGTAFTYCVQYWPLAGDDPNAYPPVVHVWSSGVEISGSPFTMSCSGSAPPYTCTDTETLGWGASYSYQFEVTGSSGATSEYPVSASSGPLVYVLRWCTGWSVGVDPTQGDLSTDFTYCVNYWPQPGDDPGAYPPSVHVWDDWSEIGGSPFAMSCTGNAAPFACTYLTTLAAGNHWLQFEVTTSSGTTVFFPDGLDWGPFVYDVPLGWCIGWYGGVDPTEGYEGDTFHYCATYTPSPGDDPNTYPPLAHIWYYDYDLEDWFEIDGSPFTMSCTGNSSPYQCDYYTSLYAGEYSYQFEVTDSSGTTSWYYWQYGPIVYYYEGGGWGGGTVAAPGDPRGESRVGRNGIGAQAADVMAEDWNRIRSRLPGCLSVRPRAGIAAIVE